MDTTTADPGMLYVPGPHENAWVLNTGLTTLLISLLVLFLLMAFILYCCCIMRQRDPLEITYEKKAITVYGITTPNASSGGQYIAKTDMAPADDFVEISRKNDERYFVSLPV